MRRSEVTVPNSSLSYHENTQAWSQEIVRDKDGEAAEQRVFIAAGPSVDYLLQ